MIPKSGYRFSEKIMLHHKLERDDDSKKSHLALGQIDRRSIPPLTKERPGRAGPSLVLSPLVAGSVANAAGPDDLATARREHALTHDATVARIAVGPIRPIPVPAVAPAVARSDARTERSDPDAYAAVIETCGQLRAGGCRHRKSGSSDEAKQNLVHDLLLRCSLLEESTSQPDDRFIRGGAMLPPRPGATGIIRRVFARIGKERPE